VTCSRHSDLVFLPGRRLAAGRRDASFYDSPGRSWVVHVAVRVPSGQLGPGVVPACDTLRAYLVDDLLEPAVGVPPASRCRRSACVRWYHAVDTAAVL
jgi:hypothetical protein